MKRIIVTALTIMLSGVLFYACKDNVNSGFEESLELFADLEIIQQGNSGCYLEDSV